MRPAAVAVSLRSFLIALALGSISLRAAAEPEAAAGEGRELFIARCSVCHSIDYIEMHARFGTRALWEASVTKMRNAFKAPIADDEARQLLDYLQRNYGPTRDQRTTPSSSISNTSVAPGLTAGGEPRSP
jgi:mono/diheme cytochrome c family protein